MNKAGRLKFGDQAMVKPNSLILSPRLSIESWKGIGERIWQISKSSSWWLGDWLVYGQDRYPERYSKAMKESLLDYQTLKNYAWVARKFPPSRRRGDLSLQHHAEVASLPEREQDAWLDLTVSHRWTRNELRRRLRSAHDGSDEAKEPTSFQIQLKLNEERRQRWERAAIGSGLDLIQWIQSILDQASVASPELMAAGQRADNH